jgi:hypothetical protein
LRKGKTPILDAAEVRTLLDSIGGTSHVDLRDKALIGLMLYSFARIGAVVGMAVEDVFVQNRRLWVRLHEKGGKLHGTPHGAAPPTPPGIRVAYRGGSIGLSRGRPRESKWWLRRAAWTAGCPDMRQKPVGEPAATAAGVVCPGDGALTTTSVLGAAAYYGAVLRHRGLDPTLGPA